MEHKKSKLVTFFAAAVLLTSGAYLQSEHVQAARTSSKNGYITTSTVESTGDEKKPAKKTNHVSKPKSTKPAKPAKPQNSKPAQPTAPAEPGKASQPTQASQASQPTEPREVVPTTTVGYEHIHENKVDPTPVYDLYGLVDRVVQAPYIKGKDLYALQVVTGSVTIRMAELPAAPKINEGVKPAKKNNKKKTTKKVAKKTSKKAKKVTKKSKAKTKAKPKKPAVVKPITVEFSDEDNMLTIQRGGHTQTWQYAGNNKWFVGIDPRKDQFSSYSFDQDIARISYSEGMTTTDDFVRLTNLNYASDDPNYTADEVQRSEAAVSPNGKYLLLTSLQYPTSPTASHHAFSDLNVTDADAQNVHFAIYDLKAVNQKLDDAEANGETEVSVADLKPLAAFHVNNVYGNFGDMPAMQGIAIDNNKNLYISSENPEIKHHSLVPRQIIRVPWGQTNTNAWYYTDLDTPEWKYWLTEMEGLQILGKDIYFNMSLHNPDTNDTEKNIIYKVPNIVK